MFELTPEEAENGMNLWGGFFADLGIDLGQHDTADDPFANFDLVLVGKVFVLIPRSKVEDDSRKE